MIAEAEQHIALSNSTSPGNWKSDEAIHKLKKNEPNPQTNDRSLSDTEADQMKKNSSDTEFSDSEGEVTFSFFFFTISKF